MLDYYDDDTDYTLDDLKEWLSTTEDPNTSFHLFCQHGDVEAVKLFLKHPRFFPYWGNNSGFRAAVRYGRKEIVDILLNTNLLHYDKALETAAEENELELVKVLVEKYEAFVIYSIIHKASYYEHGDVVEYLIEAKKDKFIKGNTEKNAWSVVDKNCAKKILEKRKEILLPEVLEVLSILEEVSPKIKIGKVYYSQIPKDILKKIVIQKYMEETSEQYIQRKVVEELFR